jgi:hypothetical protein
MRLKKNSTGILELQETQGTPISTGHTQNKAFLSTLNLSDYDLLWSCSTQTHIISRVAGDTEFRRRVQDFGFPPEKSLKSRYGNRLHKKNGSSTGGYKQVSDHESIGCT